MLQYEYANALYELALKNKKLPLINDNYKMFIEGIKENPSYIDVLVCPRLSIKQKKESIKSVTNQMDDLFTDFLFVLIDNNRINYVKDIYDEFVKLVNDNDNVLTADVISASKLSNSQTKELNENLSKYFGGKKILMNLVIDPQLIGGIRVIANGKSLDFSLQAKLDILKEKI